MADETMMENTSGAGQAAVVPAEIANKFNWGAFLLSWIWGLGNATYITLLMIVGYILCLIPIVGWLICLGLAIWFGFKGNEWAWRNKRFESVEAFNDYQKKWTIAGIIVAVIGIVWMVLSFLLVGVLMFAGSSAS